jgi:hypothetical protein
MADGHHMPTADVEGAHEHPTEGEPVGGHEGDDVIAGHDVHGHDDHDHGHHDDAHADHASGGDAWVLIPIIIGLVIGLALALSLGFGSGASPLG